MFSCVIFGGDGGVRTALNRRPIDSRRKHNSGLPRAVKYVPKKKIKKEKEKSFSCAVMTSSGNVGQTVTPEMKMGKEVWI